MSYVIADRVQQTTTTTGTGTITFSATVPQYQSFAEAVGAGNTCDYSLISGNGVDWETGFGTVDISGSVTTLSRDTVYASSRNGNRINLSGTSFAFVAITAAKVLSGSQGLSTGDYIVDCNLSPLQHILNEGDFTIIHPNSDGSCIVLVTNTASAGSITFAGFAVGSNTGDILESASGHQFSIFIWRINGVSGYRIAAHQ